MVLYRRNRVAGGTYFFTVTLQNRNLTLLVDWIDELRVSVREL
jgi:putative transposase